MPVSDPAVRRPSTGKPVFCMVGINADRGMCRLYASRDLKNLDWGMRDMPDYTTAWHVESAMQHVLVIDKPTWGECFAKAFEIWDNEDREKARVEAERQPALPREHKAISKETDLRRGKPKMLEKSRED